MTDCYGVFGNPVKHSKSPLIHSLFAAQTNQPISYEAVLVELDEFKNSVNSFFGQGGRGLNITVPFKEQAWQLADKCSPEADLAQAVNTLLVNSAGIMEGHNTDGPGLVRDIIDNHQGTLAGKSVLLLGAGGASRGILLPLLRQNPGLIQIANRTVEKAQSLVQIFAPYGPVQASGFAELAGSNFDMVINATSASLQGELPPLPAQLLAPQAWCYDLMYSTEPTAFCQWASGQGAEKVLDGLGMLVEQAAESFALWRGIRPATAPVIKALKNKN